MIAGAMYAAFLTNSRRDTLCFCFAFSLLIFALPVRKCNKRASTPLPLSPLDDQQLQLPQSAHHRGYVIEHHMLLHVKFLRKQSRNLNRVGNVVPLVPDEARSFVKLMNFLKFRIQQQQFLLTPAQDKTIPPLDRNCHSTPESCGVKFRKTTSNLMLSAAESDSEVIMELPKSEES